jgi:hypothetical protein
MQHLRDRAPLERCQLFRALPGQIKDQDGEVLALSIAELVSAQAQFSASLFKCFAQRDEFLVVKLIATDGLCPESWLTKL